MTKRTHKPSNRKRDTTNLPVIGWREWISLPGLGIDSIKTKIDTGARTSALHAFDIEVFQQAGGDWVRFAIHPLQRNDQIEHVCQCPVRETRLVTNSGGSQEDRLVIVTPITLGNQTWSIEITLTNRDEMGFRMLLGRTALRGRFVIDPGQSYCQDLQGDSENTKTITTEKWYGQDEEE